MDDYIAKPVRPEDLDAVLGRWIPNPEHGPSRRDNGDPATSAVDLSVLESRRGPQKDEEPDKLARIVTLFIDDVPPRLESLRRAVEGGEAREVEETAHLLKGGSGYMGAVRMVEICTRLQELGISGDLSRAPELIDALEAEFERVHPALRAAVAPR
jgi:HPt (histidine-containing phosphotransfer) domain-containing protein